MFTLNRAAVENAIYSAMGIFANSNPEPGLLDRFRLTDGVLAEMRLGVSRTPGHPLLEDLKAYLCALIALKSIARFRSNADRDGAVRCLIAAAKELARHRFPDEGERALIATGRLAS